MKKAIFRIITLAVLAGGGWYGYRWYQSLPSRQEQIATTRVQRGDVVIRAFTRGELHAVRSTTLVAPNLNGTVQVTRLAPVGSLAHEKDLVVEYDDSERLAALDEDNMALQQTDEQIKGAKANLGITQSQDAVTLLKTRYAVRSAELNVQKNDVTDRIDAKKNLLALEESKRAVTQLEADIAARQAQNESILAVYAEQRNRNLLDIRREELRIGQTKALAEITGLVAIRQNRTGNFNFGQVMPVIREGDTLQPGMPVADILDLSEVEVWAKVGELDRANLKEGQDALLQLDSIPDKRFHGAIKTLSGTATADVFSGDPAKKFDVVFSVDMRALLSGLGMPAAEVDRVMAMAAANGKKEVTSTAGAMFASLQVQPAGTARGPGRADTGGRVPGRTASDLMAMMASGDSRFTEEERNHAKLPLPPGQDSQVQILLRPGLLADVEITVQKLPNVLHVPGQAVFEKGGMSLVYVQQKNGRYQPREVQVVKQSESMMVLSGGVEPGEIVALADPTAEKGARKEEKKASNNPMSSMPGGR